MVLDFLSLSLQFSNGSFGFKFVNYIHVTLLIIFKHEYYSIEWLEIVVFLHGGTWGGQQEEREREEGANRLKEKKFGSAKMSNKRGGGYNFAAVIRLLFASIRFFFF
mgnify:CR=1 FL=1